MRAYALAASALGAFFAGLALWVSGLALRGIDQTALVLFGTGAALAGYTYVRERAPQARRIAVVGLGLNAAALFLHLLASR